MKCGRLLSIPILAVLCLLGFVYYITIFIFIDDWVGLQSSAGALNALIFTFFFSFSLFSFVICVLTDPGHVPSSYTRDIEDDVALYQDPNKTGTDKRHCDKCSMYKPPRTHHCRVCRRCILRMDHHCTWINNCVGHFNYKAYFILVFYAAIGSIYSTVMMICCTLQKRGDYYNENIPFKVFYIACGVITCGLTLMLGTLLGWHIYLISNNMTTIEYYEGIRASWLARKSGQSYRHPFDHGFYKNFTLVLGPNMVKWLCPTSTYHLKDGISFPTLRDRP